MITNISIENFRCFDTTKISGFKTLNLIGGKNNAGKTALLEAIFLNTLPANPGILLLQQFRNEDDDTSKKHPEMTWENLFNNQDKSKKIIISTVENGEECRVELTCDENIDDFISYIDDKNKDESEYIQIKDALLRDRKKSALHTEAFKNNDKFTSAVLVASSKGQVGRGEGISDIDKSDFIHARLQSSSKNLASDFDYAIDKGQYPYILKALQIIDNTIIEARTSSIGEPVVKLKREGEKAMPLSLFGDAIYKCTSIILKMLNGKENGVLLIDEIENGIHHSNHIHFWELLFEIAIQLRIQIFATSHSFEMIWAFNKVANTPELEKEAMYFEMSRHGKNGSIIINPMNMSALHYDIIKKNPFRGE